MKKQSLKNKIVVITGATAGVGRATALAFANVGAILALIARGEEGLASIKQEVESLGRVVRTYSLDVSDAVNMDKVIDKIEEELGPIDILINNAMCSVFAPLEKVLAEEYKRVTEVTYLGQVYAAMAILRKMRSRNYGTIILVGSALAHRGIPLQAAYCGAKHAIKGFFEALLCELKHENSAIHLTLVDLPAMNTPQFDWVLNKLPHKPKPMGTVYQPEVAAKAILFAATHKRRVIYVGWPTYLTVIGNKFLPFIFDLYLTRIGYKGQQTDESADPNSPSNVWTPLTNHHTTHGRFDKLAHNNSFMLSITMHRRLVLVGFATIILILTLIIF
jgi:short-subunit dehydrogenase